MYWFIVALNPTTISLNAKNYVEPNFGWMHYTEFLQLSVGVHRSLFKAWRIIIFSGSWYLFILKEISLLEIFLCKTTYGAPNLPHKLSSDCYSIALHYPISAIPFCTKAMVKCKTFWRAILNTCIFKSVLD